MGFKKKVISAVVDLIDSLDSPLKSSVSYIKLNSILCLSFAIIILLFNIIVNLDIWDFAWRALLSNISAYKDVVIFSFCSLVYIVVFLKRESNSTLFSAVIIKFVSTAYMVNMIFISLSMALMDLKILDMNEWGEILPYRFEYPIFAMIMLTLVWWSTWYASLKQRKVLKSEEPNHQDVFDHIRGWLSQWT
ncbi:membrane hypothetical protein [Vibrio chagasii]|uniref:hypothetical protein n=1 Tax=Vibrio chagasii TaxID=170679 RepID=UPI00164152E8|nr:hypothetical protein [Vibrio chagasii]CAH6850721.1 membrane hypothetical protein [Vibrio chagasii]CAH6908538.1 membrane hypothetical protein [Vibrio chagasii]CAH6991668.1 membrane hypothetical protein [Vibrio chagasii]CAH7006471.1 membrane hypothetical protein [Vibrio chagasii]CAH7048846.1 membrane hypothetical protein [Vibrio chagasii]